jgi:hypothetical protein
MSNTKADWRKGFQAAMIAAANKAGVDASTVQFEGCTTDRTWGDRCGLVFYGADAAILERCAKYFETWASKHLSRGEYSAQSSIHYEGKFHYNKFTNGAAGWYRGEAKPYVASMIGDFLLDLVEVKEGYATSYVYYPCAD